MKEITLKNNKLRITNLMYFHEDFFKVICDNIPAGQSPLSQPPKPLMAIRSSRGLSHLRPEVFHISLQYTLDTACTIERWKKRRTNKHGLGLVPSARRENFVTLLCCFLCICGLSWARIRAKFPQSRQEFSLILSRWPTRPLGPQVLAPRLAVISFWFLLTALSWWLLSSVHCPGPCFTSSPSGLVGNLTRKLFLWVSRQKQTKEYSDWHSPTPTEMNTTYCSTHSTRYL